jgi:hypothetical protein
MPGQGLDNLTLSDLEFENDQLVKVRGMPSSYMGGHDLISLVRQLGVLLHRAIKPSEMPTEAYSVDDEPAAPAGTDVPQLVLHRAGDAKSLRSCPAGPFLFDGQIAIKLSEPMQNGHTFAYQLNSGEFFYGGTGGHARELLVVQPARLGPPKWMHPTPDDWTLDDTATADEILLLLGEPGSASKEPGADWKRDRIASIIRGRTDAAVAQEREGSAFAVECHSGFGDPESIEACAALVRARAEEKEECVHLHKARYAAIMDALYRMSDALEKLGETDPRTASAYRTTMEYAKQLSKDSREPPEFSPSAEENPAVLATSFKPKFKVGDEVQRTSGGKWLGMEVGDRGIVTEVRATANNWHEIRIEGYHGLYSDFRYKLAKDVDGELSKATNLGQRSESNSEWSGG